MSCTIGSLTSTRYKDQPKASPWHQVLTPTFWWVWFKVWFESMNPSRRTSNHYIRKYMPKKIRHTASQTNANDGAKHTVRCLDTQMYTYVFICPKHMNTISLPLTSSSCSSSRWRCLLHSPIFLGHWWLHPFLHLSLFGPDRRPCLATKSPSCGHKFILRMRTLTAWRRESAKDFCLGVTSWRAPHVCHIVDIHSVNHSGCQVETRSSQDSPRVDWIFAVLSWWQETYGN